MVPTLIANLQVNWSRWHRMSSWRPATRRRGHCFRPHEPYLSCLQSFPIQSAPDLSTVWRDPGGNATGFTSFSYDIGGKWLELLREIAPRVKRVAVLRDSNFTAGVGQWSAVQTAAPSLGMEASPINLRDASELEHAVSTFARYPNGGLIVTSSGLAISHRHMIIAQAAQHRLPAVYYSRGFVSAGGLISYGSDRVDQFRRAAVYVDRILRGDKPSDLPVQNPTRYELVINLKTARTLGLDVSFNLQQRADEVIE